MASLVWIGPYGSPASAQQLPLVDCPFNGGVGDLLDRGFYLPTYPGTSIGVIELWLSADRVGSHSARLTAHMNTYDGPELGSRTATATLTERSFSVVRFPFGNVGVAPGSRVAFTLEVTGGPGGRVFYSTRQSPDCPIVQTNGTAPPLDTPRFSGRGVAIRIFGNPVPPEVVVDCLPRIKNDEGALQSTGDGISRGFYVRSFPSDALTRVNLWTWSNTGGEQTFRLTARRDRYDGALLGRSTATVDMLPSEEGRAFYTLTTFDFPSATVTPGSTVTFALERTAGSGPVFYAREPDSDDCPTVQTNGTSPPLDTPRFGGRPVAARIWGTEPPNLRAGRLEITQAVQDLNNSVRLVAGKRTFVRFHVSSADGNHASYATLRVQRGEAWNRLLPIGGSSTVRESPDRGELDHAFLFELPSYYRQGTVTFTGELNPDLTWRDHSPIESTYADNTTTITKTFENVPRVNLVVYRIGYRDGSSTYYAPTWQRDQMVDWLERAYPLDDLRVWNRTLFIGDGLPTCGEVNNSLKTQRLLNLVLRIFGLTSVPSNAHYYGMVDDRGGFMRGCSDDIPSAVAAGPTGTRAWEFSGGGLWSVWDDDGTFGDWYGGHEIAHSYGRFHVGFCGAGGSAPYPHPDGEISPTQVGNAALYGFDLGNRAIYGPDWHELMTYCDKQWISDFTYEGLMDYFQDELALVPDGVVAGQVVGQRLLILGTVDLRRRRLDLHTVRPLPDIGDLEPRVPGTFTIQLRDAAGRIVARYPFTPSASSEEGQDIVEGRTVDQLFISEFVPLPDGTVDVTITGPNGIRETFAAGPSAPTVRVVSPNGGEVFDGPTVPVSWSASDRDRDPLSFSVQYTPDGERWETVAVNLTETSVDLDAANLPAGNAARIRVLATDGFRSAADESDGPFRVQNRPPDVRIEEPVGAITISSEDTLALVGSAYDIDDGPLSGQQLQWSSSIQRNLGVGSPLAVTGLQPGVHTVRLRATDSHGGSSEDTVRVTVVADPSDLPPDLPDELVPTPRSIWFDVDRGATNQMLAIANADATESIPWSAQTTVPWIGLSHNRGATPSDVLVQFVDTGLPEGEHNGAIRLTSTALPRGVVVTVPVRVTVPEGSGESAFLRADANANGGVDIADPTALLNFLFLGGVAPPCPDAADANDSGALDLSDAVYTLTFLFLGGPPPPAPYPECGIDPTPDGLGACVFVPCP